MTKISAENESALARLNSLRTAYKTLETTEKQRIAALVREKLSAERQAIEHLMAQLKNNGVPVRRIGSAFGTSNHTTVLEWITAGETLLTLDAPEIQTPSTTGTPTVEKVDRTVIGRPGWKVTWPDGESVEVYTSAQTNELTAIGANRDRWLADPTLANLIKEAA